MSNKLNHPRGWNVGRCQHIAENYLAWFIKYVAQETRKGQRPLDVKELESLSQRFCDSEPSVRLLLQESFFSCNQARLNKAWQDNRQDYLVRLLVEQILPLFVENGGPNINDGGLSRTMLPGLFDAIKEALGNDAIEDYNIKCSIIVDKLHAKSGDAFEWDDFFEDSGARQILVQVLAGLAHYFDDFELGRKSFINTVNAGLPQNKGSGQKGKRDWHFDGRHFKVFASYFFLPLTKAIYDSGEDEQLEADFDLVELERIKSFLDQIGRLS